MFLVAVTSIFLALQPVVGTLPSVLTLDGPGWTLKNPSKNISAPAVVPGSVHLDLKRAQIIGNPYYG